MIRKLVCLYVTFSIKASKIFTRVEDHDSTEKADLGVVEVNTIQHVSVFELLNKKFSEWHLVHQISVHSN